MALSNLHIGEHTVLGFARSWVLGMTLIGALGARPVQAASLPVGVADNYSVREDQTLDVARPGVLVNDPDADGPPLTAVLVMEPDHGMVSFNSDGSFSYTPNWNFHGTDSFIYQAQDGTTHSSPVAVTLTVLSVNDAPIARANNYSISEDTALMIAAPGVLGNDLDMDGDPLSAVRVGLPRHGTLTFKADGSFTYRPDTNFHGTDSFTYTAQDATTNSRPATVTLTVTSVNDRPTVQILELTGLQNTPLCSNVAVWLAAAADEDNDPLFLASYAPTSTQGGTVELEDTRWTYRPPLDYVGPDAFTVAITDGMDGLATNTVHVMVLAPEWEVLDALPARLASGIPSRIDRLVKLQDGRMRIEFTGLPGHTYAVQYSDDLTAWRTATPLHEATASREQWIDNDPPKALNDSPATHQRFYRLFRLPAS